MSNRAKHKGRVKPPRVYLGPEEREALKNLAVFYQMTEPNVLKFAFHQLLQATITLEAKLAATLQPQEVSNDGESSDVDGVQSPSENGEFSAGPGEPSTGG